jgi:uncharacterized protein YrrD
MSLSSGESLAGFLVAKAKWFAHTRQEFSHRNVKRNVKHESDIIVITAQGKEMVTHWCSTSKRLMRTLAT